MQIIWNLEAFQARFPYDMLKYHNINKASKVLE